MPSRHSECFDTQRALVGLDAISAPPWPRLLLPLLLLALPPSAPAQVSAPASLLMSLPAGWRDDQGQPFDLHSLNGRAVVLTMAYASCHRICPISIGRLEQMQHDFDLRGTNAEFVIIGYDPEVDDSATWRQYRATRRLNRSNWHFLVGTPPMVAQTARQLGFGFWKYDAHVMHELRILQFDERGMLTAAENTAIPQVPPNKPR